MGSLKLSGATSGHVEIAAPDVAGTQTVEFPTDVVQKSELEWTAYTPTWTASGGSPAVGNGTLEGEYIRVGELCHLRVRLDIGSTTSTAGNAWLFSLPELSVGAAAGSVLIYDASAAVKSGTAHIQSGSAWVFAHVQGTGTVGATIPVTWVTGDYLQISVTYKVAA